jgi:hypothetical protein
MFDIGGVAGSATIGFVLSRFFNNEGCLGAGVETLLSAGTLLTFLAFAQSGVTVNSILMLITGALNCGADIILCKFLLSGHQDILLLREILFASKPFPQVFFLNH